MPSHSRHWSADEDRRFLLSLIVSTGSTVDFESLAANFPGRTTKALRERLTKVRREARDLSNSGTCEVGPGRISAKVTKGGARTARGGPKGTSKKRGSNNANVDSAPEIMQEGKIKEEEAMMIKDEYVDEGEDTGRMEQFIENHDVDHAGSEPCNEGIGYGILVEAKDEGQCDVEAAIEKEGDNQLVEDVEAAIDSAPRSVMPLSTTAEDQESTVDIEFDNVSPQSAGTPTPVRAGHVIGKGDAMDTVFLALCLPHTPGIMAECMNEPSSKITGNHITDFDQEVAPQPTINDDSLDAAMPPGPHENTTEANSEDQNTIDQLDDANNIKVAEGESSAPKAKLGKIKILSLKDSYRRYT